MRVPNDLPDDNSGASSPPLDMEAEAGAHFFALPPFVVPETRWHWAFNVEA